jgi:hypothetical protein
MWQLGHKYMVKHMSLSNPPNDKNYLMDSCQIVSIIHGFAYAKKTPIVNNNMVQES